MTTIINLTPHDLRLKMNVYPDRTKMQTHVTTTMVTIPSQGIARVSTTMKVVGSIRNDGFSDFDHISQKMGDVTGLPPPMDDVIYVTSLMVRLAVPNRRDVFSPIDLVRDDQGRVIGANGLSGNDLT